MSLSSLISEKNQLVDYIINHWPLLLLLRNRLRFIKLKCFVPALSSSVLFDTTSHSFQLLLTPLLERFLVLADSSLRHQIFKCQSLLERNLALIYVFSSLRAHFAYNSFPVACTNRSRSLAVIRILLLIPRVNLFVHLLQSFLSFLQLFNLFSLSFEIAPNRCFKLFFFRIPFKLLNAQEIHFRILDLMDSLLRVFS